MAGRPQRLGSPRSGTPDVGVVGARNAGFHTQPSAKVVMTTPTQRWLQAAPASLPRLSGAQSTAERLLLLLHYGIDWESSWVARRRETYWSHHLPNRVRLATYIGASDLDHWWAVVSRGLESEPSGAEQRLELATLLREPAVPVLGLLRSRPTSYVLRIRIVAESVQAQRAARRKS